VDIGQPRRIIEIQPIALPVPGPLEPSVPRSPVPAPFEPEVPQISPLPDPPERQA
jgi:hypothetical protein